MKKSLLPAFRIPVLTPRTIIILYVSAIFGFTGLFSLIPEDFHHSTVTKEKEVLSKINELKKDYYAFMESAFQNADHSDGAPKVWFLFEDFDVSGEDVKIKIDFHADMGEGTSGVGFVQLDIKFRKNMLDVSYGDMKVFKIDQENEDKYAVVELNASVRMGECQGDCGKIVAYLKRRLENQYFYNVPKPYMKLPRRLWNETKDVANTLSGSVKNLNSFPILLYLSTMTITTTGYGDIVPVSGLARAFVALEAIIGIVLIGLFVNSVSSHISHKQAAHRENQERAKSQPD